MIQKLIHRILLRRHFWRYATFSEIAELYSSRLLRMMALHIVASFMSIYLYQIGYSVLFIAGFWAVFFALKAILSLPAAAITAWIGPKHAILLSNILYIPSMIAFALVPQFGVSALVVVLLFKAISIPLYSIAYMADFSKVKSFDHAGKEIAIMNIIEKLTAGLSPLIGGLLAFAFGPSVVMIMAAVLFALSAAPLLATAEQVSPRKKLNFKGFAWHLVRPVSVAHFAVGFDVFTSGTVWSLFYAIFIIGIASSNEVYAVSGLLSSVVLFAALASSYAYGLLIDRRKGRELLVISTIVNALTHASRPFTNSAVNVAGLNVANEAATTGYMMAYNRAIFDNADLSGQRVAYLGVLEVIANIGATAAAVVLMLLIAPFGDQSALQTLFFITAAVALLVLTARFPLYRKK